MINFQAEFDRYPPAQYDGLFLWDFLKGAFGPSIKPMDFDAVVERRGSFLVFETKARGTTVPGPQRDALTRAVHDRRWTVVLCAKRPEDIDGWEVWTATGTTIHRGDATALWWWCNAWYEDKNNRDPVW